MSSAIQQLDPLERNKQLIIRWFEEVWNRGNRNAIAELFHENAVLHDGVTDIRGPQEFHAFYDSLRAQFSEYQIKPVVVLAEDNLVCMHWSADFRHKESGKSVHITGTSVVRVEGNQFVEGWQNWDAAGVQAQLAAQ
ncbi:MAG TPA: nuclear transport factor 2 family protein [Candidatus Saccharimonadales bacterium]|nr:nuclear transport factor 2 family protein [Candidatus Saccharimonadales bacterium]